MFSKTCEYAIRAMLYIAQKSKDGERVSIKEISKGIDSPEHFIAKILQELSRKNLVLSIKGPNGGIYHNETTLQFSLADIVKTIDGNKLFEGCGLGLKQCSESHPCPIHTEFKNLRNGVTDLLENSKLGTFTKELEKQILFLRR